MTTFPTCFCDARYSKASLVSWNEKTWSTCGCICLAERRRFMSLNLWECDTRMPRIDTDMNLLRKRPCYNTPQHWAPTNNCQTGMYFFITLEKRIHGKPFDIWSGGGTDLSNSANTVNPSTISHGLKRFRQSTRTAHLYMNQTEYKQMTIWKTSVGWAR